MLAFFFERYHDFGGSRFGRLVQYGMIEEPRAMSPNKMPRTSSVLRAGNAGSYSSTSDRSCFQHAACRECLVRPRQHAVDTVPYCRAKKASEQRGQGNRQIEKEKKRRLLAHAVKRNYHYYGCGV